MGFDPDRLKTKRALLVSGLFDAEYYCQTYADIRHSGGDPLTHYVMQGEAEGRSPNPVFFPRYYRRRWMAGAPATQNALAHYAEEATQKEEKLAALLRLARVWRRKVQQPERAAGVYEGVIDLVPGHQEATSFLADHFTSLEQWEHLVALYEGQLSTGALRSCSV